MRFGAAAADPAAGGPSPRWSRRQTQVRRCRYKCAGEAGESAVYTEHVTYVVLTFRSFVQISAMMQSEGATVEGREEMIPSYDANNR